MDLRRSSWLLLGIVPLLGLASSASAAPVFCGTPPTICYDDVLLSNIEYTGIQETVTTADDIPGTANDGLYGEPSGSGTGTLNFAPTSYDATSPEVGTVFDQTHSGLIMTITSSDPLTPLEIISITETGSYSFGGAGTANTGVIATVGGVLTITNTVSGGGPLIGEQINLLDDVPDPLGTSDTLTVTTSGPNTPIGGGFFVDFTQGDGTYQFEYVLDLTGLDITELTLSFNNTLQASSEDGASATIVKESLTIVPEPGTLSLLGLGLVGCAAARRRTR